MNYQVTHTTPKLAFLTSRLGDVIARHKITGKEVYFQPGDAGAEMLTILDECPPDDALHIFMEDYFQTA